MKFTFAKKPATVAAALAPLNTILANLEEVIAAKQLEAAEARADISDIEEKARREVIALSINETNAQEEAKQAATVLTRLSALLA